MTRVLMIDGNRKLTESVGRQCLEQNIAIRMADTFCEGVRQLLEIPVSLILVHSDLARLPGAELGRLFETVAPGVPVVVRVEAGQGISTSSTCSSRASGRRAWCCRVPRWPRPLSRPPAREPRDRKLGPEK
jgi:hypothetical protein